MRGGHGGPANPPRALPLWRQHGPAAVGESADVDRAGSVLRHGLGHWLGGGTPSPRHDRSVPHAAAGRDVPGHPRCGRREPRGGAIRPSGGPALWPDPVSPPGGDSQTDWGRVDPAWLLSFRKQSTNNSRRCRTSHQLDRPPDSERTWAGRPPFDVAACQDGHLPLAAGALLAREEALAHHRVPT